MTKNEFLRLFEEVIEAEPETIHGDEQLDDLEGWDSLALVAFIAMVDEHFGISLSAKSIHDSESIPDLISLFGDKISE